LDGQQTNEIGIILVSRTGRYSDPFYNAILEGAAEKLHQLGYRIAYINTRFEVSSVTQARELLRSHPVDGIILVGFVSAESIDFLKANVRAVIQTTDDYGSGIDTISFDGYGGMREMVNHLVQLGHRRLGFIAGSGGHDGRLRGFMDAVQAHGLPMDGQLSLILPHGLDGWTPELGQQGAEHLMTLAEPPDAIVCASDRIAMGAIQWLHQHNYNVPQDVAVTGFDNLRESAFTAPALTTVHIHKELIGQLAAERAVKHIQHPDEIPLYIQTPTSLVIRQSCGNESL
jgi:DNA-binding LacI/PurR family transcriptional regulator